MIKVGFLISLLAVACSAQTFCDKYCNLTGLFASDWVRPVTYDLYDQFILPGNPILEYFNGSKPPGSTDFTDPSNIGLFFNMKEQTTRIFANIFGCSDGTVQPYTGGSFPSNHASFQIDYFAYNSFNEQTCQHFGAFLDDYAGYSAADLEQVGNALDAFRTYICTEPDCSYICNKYSVPCVRDNSAFVGGLVEEVLDTINATYGYDCSLSNQTLEWIETYVAGLLNCTDGTVPPYTGPNVTAILETLCLSNATFDAALDVAEQALLSYGLSSTDTAAVIAILESFRPLAVRTCSSSGGALLFDVPENDPHAEDEDSASTAAAIVAPCVIASLFLTQW